MESNFARGEAVNKAEIAHMREKVERLKQGSVADEDPTQNLMALIANG